MFFQICVSLLCLGLCACLLLFVLVMRIELLQFKLDTTKRLNVLGDLCRCILVRLHAASEELELFSGFSTLFGVWKVASVQTVVEM